MQFDFTGIFDSGSDVALEPGRYRVSTKDNWTISKNDKGNLNVRVPFLVMEEGEFQGAPASFYHTIVQPPANYNSLSQQEKAEWADRLRKNKVFTLRLFSALGLVTDEDRGPNGEVQASFVYGDKDDYDRTAINGLNVNGTVRNLDGRAAVAVVVTSNYTNTGVKVDSLEPSGTPNTNTPPTPVTPQPATVAQGEQVFTGSTKQGNTNDIPF